MRHQLKAVEPKAFVKAGSTLVAQYGVERVPGALVELARPGLHLQPRSDQRERVQQTAHREHVHDRERKVLFFVDHGPLYVVQAGFGALPQPGLRLSLLNTHTNILLVRI